MNSKVINVYHKSFKKYLIIFTNIIIFLFLIRWFVNNIDFRLFMGSFQLIPLWAGIGTVAINISAIVFYGLRMSLFLDSPFKKSFGIIMLGYGFNALLPFRLGEAAKIFYANRIYSVSATKLVRALFLEHLFDLTVVLFLGFMAIYFRQEIIKSSIIYFLTGIVLTLFLVMISFKGVFLKSPWGERLNRSNIFRTLSNIFDITMERRKLFSIAFYTMTIWFFNLFTIYYSFNLFFNDIPFSIINAIVLLIIMSLAIAMPSAPAGVGLYEAGIVAYLVYAFNISNERALASAFLFHFLVTIPQIISTVIVLLKNKLTSRKFLIKLL